MVFRPKLLESLRHYTAEDFIRDLVAGLTVGIVALPLAMAFGIASGVNPAAGLYTAVVAGFLIAALGGSRVQIGGPTGAFIPIVYGIVVAHGQSNLTLCTLLAGILLLVFGLTRLGTIIKFIPYPVTAGFTAGIAVIIFSTQLKDFFGLQVEKVPSHFIQKLQTLAANASTIHWPTVILALSSFLLIFFWPKKWQRRVPGSVVAMVLATGVSMFLHLPIQTIGSQFGEIPRNLPPFTIPHLSISDVQLLFRDAFIVAVLGAIESLLCAVVADGMIDDRHDSNQELMAQGIANIGCSFFGGIPATGAIARTATNVKNGARTPVSGMIHALTLLLILIVAAPLAKNIPLAVLSAVLINVAINMGEWHHFADLVRWPKSDTIVYLATFALTVIIDLTVAVEIGLVMAAVLFIRRVSETTQITAAAEPTPGKEHPDPRTKHLPSGVVVFRIFGAFFFGAVDKLQTALKRTGQPPRVLVLQMDSVYAIDATGLKAIEELHRKMSHRHGHLLISGAHSQPLMAMHKSDFLENIGEQNLCPDLDAAIERARQLASQKHTTPADAAILE